MKTARVLVPTLAVLGALVTPYAGTASTASTASALSAPTASPGHHRADAQQRARAHRGKLPKVREYVSLGDSWSADVVLANADGVPDTTYAPIDCAQSHHNYPKIVAAALGVRTLRDATCGSATTETTRPSASRLTRMPPVPGRRLRSCSATSAGTDVSSVVEPVETRIA